MRSALWSSLGALLLATACTPPGSPAAPARPARALAQKESLYVADDRGISEYSLPELSKIRTVRRGVSVATSIAFDSANFLYVANLASSTVTVYAPEATAPARTVTVPIYWPRAIALDGAGRLHVADQDGTILIFKPRSTKLERTIRTRIGDEPQALAFDREGLLYEADATGGGAVGVFSPSSPHERRVLHRGIADPVALAFDSRDRLYVLNHTANGSFAVFESGSRVRVRFVQRGMRSPTAFAVDTLGTVFVAGIEEVAAFAKGDDRPSYAIVKKVAAPSALALDAEGRLYVANYFAGTVTVYARGSSTPLRTLEHLGHPDLLAVRPR